MRVDWIDIVFPPAGSLAFLFLSWSTMRTINAGRPLDRVQRRLVAYRAFFAVGMCYIMAVGSWLHWPAWIWFTLIAAWGVLILYIAWRRSQRKQTGAEAPKAKIPYLAAGLPTVGLLVGLIGSWVEWTLVAEDSGRLGVGLRILTDFAPRMAYPLIGATGVMELAALAWWGIGLWHVMTLSKIHRTTILRVPTTAEAR